MNNDLALKMEALLYALGKPLTRTELADMLGCSSEEIDAAAKDLRREDRGIVCVDDGKTLELRISSKAASMVEDLRKEELNRDIGRAGLEALAAVLYRGPLTRAEIDFIRGVNSSQTLRTLLMRGLVRKVQNPKDERSFLYEPTTELLAQLGVQHRDELPEFASVRSKLDELEAAYRVSAQARTQEADSNDETHV